MERRSGGVLDTYEIPFCLDVMKHTALITGAGGFIGHHMVKFLKDKGYSVRGVDIKKPEFEKTAADEYLLLDLRDAKNAKKAVRGVSEVYNFAANMGGVAFIDSVHADIMHDNLLININMLESAKNEKVNRFFFSSSACVYPKEKQRRMANSGLRESDAFPADPDTKYGWEKLTAEQLCLAYYEDYGLETRIARFHNVYGPLGTWTGGREKSPAALCRKVAEAEDNGTVTVWGDGKQTRSYCYINDCIRGIDALMRSEVRTPVNIGSNRLISVDEMALLIADIAGKKIHLTHDRYKPQGVRGRNADIQAARRMLQWKPRVSLEEGLRQTYTWIDKQIHLHTKNR